MGHSIVYYGAQLRRGRGTGSIQRLRTSCMFGRGPCSIIYGLPPTTCIYNDMS